MDYFLSVLNIWGKGFRRYISQHICPLATILCVFKDYLIPTWAQGDSVECKCSCAFLCPIRCSDPSSRVPSRHPLCTKIGILQYSPTSTFVPFFGLSFGIPQVKARLWLFIQRICVRPMDTLPNKVPLLSLETLQLYPHVLWLCITGWILDKHFHWVMNNPLVITQWDTWQSPS